MPSEDRESIDEVAVMLAMPAMTTTLAGFAFGRRQYYGSPGVSCPCGEQWGDHGDDKKGRSYPTKS